MSKDIIIKEHLVPQKLRDEVKKDLELNDNNIAEKSLRQPIIYTKYNDHYHKVLGMYHKLNLELTETYKDLYHHYKFNYNFALSTKVEIESYVKADPKYTNIKEKLDRVDITLKYLENVLKNVSNMGFQIKNFIDYQKFINGVV